jgi:hypothetical protein
VAGKIWAIDEKPPAVFLAERLRLIPTPAPGLTPEGQRDILSILSISNLFISDLPFRHLGVQNAGRSCRCGATRLASGRC